MCLRVRCWLPFGRCVLPSSRCVNRAVSFVERRCNSGSLPLGCPALPSAAPARGAVAPLAAERSRPTAPAMWLQLPCLCTVGASTGAPLLAVVDAVPGDLHRLRAGAHGCATFLSLVSLSSRAPVFATLLRALVAVLALLAPAAATRNPNATTLKVIAPLLARIPSCQLSAAESHCLQRWAKRLTNSNHSTK